MTGLGLEGVRLEDLRRAVLFRILVANEFVAVGGWLSATSVGAVLGNVPFGVHGGLLLAMVVVLAPVAALVVNKTLAPVATWVGVRRPTEAESRWVLRIPWLVAAFNMLSWAVAAIAWAIVPLLYPDGVADSWRTGVFVLMGGPTASAIAFLFVERSLRPLFALALADRRLVRSGVLGVRLRLLLAWVLGSALPLLAIGVLLLERTPSEAARLVADLPKVVWFLGIVSGGFMTVIAARSVADPVDRVRDALERVEEGDLDHELVVDDGSEVGMLQSGFNRMVRGLRERERLHDLFGRYVGEEVARSAMDRDGGLRGESVEASALFVDVIGSTRLAAAAAPNEVVELLNRFFATVVETVEAEAGWVNKFAGDAALCIFGPPDGTSDHPRRALRAARLLRSRLADLKERYPALEAGIGVSSGRVVAGNVGAERRYEYTLIGDAVNEASRLSELAKHTPGRVLAAGPTIETAGAAEGAHWEPGESVTLRGRPTPTATFRPVLAASEAAGGREADFSGETGN